MESSYNKLFEENIWSKVIKVMLVSRIKGFSFQPTWPDVLNMVVTEER